MKGPKPPKPIKTAEGKKVFGPDGQLIRIKRPYNRTAPLTKPAKSLAAQTNNANIAGGGTTSIQAGVLSANGTIIPGSTAPKAVKVVKTIESTLLNGYGHLLTFNGTLPPPRSRRLVNQDAIGAGAGAGSSGMPADISEAQTGSGSKVSKLVRRENYVLASIISATPPTPAPTLGNFCQSILRVSTLHILQTSAGYDAVQANPLAVLVDCMDRFMSMMAQNSKQFAEHAGRTQVNIFDVVNGLSACGIELSELEEWTKDHGWLPPPKVGDDGKQPTLPVSSGKILPSWRGADPGSAIHGLLWSGREKDRDDYEVYEWHELPADFVQPTTDEEQDAYAYGDLNERKQQQALIEDEGAPTQLEPLAKTGIRKERWQSNARPSHIPEYLPPFPGTALDNDQEREEGQEEMPEDTVVGTLVDLRQTVEDISMGVPNESIPTDTTQSTSEAENRAGSNTLTASLTGSHSLENNPYTQVVPLSETSFTASSLHRATLTLVTKSKASTSTSGKLAPPSTQQMFSDALLAISEPHQSTLATGARQKRKQTILAQSVARPLEKSDTLFCTPVQSGVIDALLMSSASLPIINKFTTPGVSGQDNLPSPLIGGAAMSHSDSGTSTIAAFAGVEADIQRHPLGIRKSSISGSPLSNVVSMTPLDSAATPKTGKPGRPKKSSTTALENFTIIESQTPTHLSMNRTSSTGTQSAIRPIAPAAMGSTLAMFPSTTSALSNSAGNGSQGYIRKLSMDQGQIPFSDANMQSQKQQSLSNVSSSGSTIQSFTSTIASFPTTSLPHTTTPTPTTRPNQPITSLSQSFSGMAPIKSEVMPAPSPQQIRQPISLSDSPYKPLSKPTAPNPILAATGSISISAGGSKSKSKSKANAAPPAPPPVTAPSVPIVPKIRFKFSDLKAVTIDYTSESSSSHKSKHHRSSSTTSNGSSSKHHKSKKSSYDYGSDDDDMVREKKKKKKSSSKEKHSHEHKHHKQHKEKRSDHRHESVESGYHHSYGNSGSSATALSYQSQGSTGAAAEEPPTDVIDCICHNPHLDDGLFMIACDACEVWFHGHCVGIRDGDGVETWFCQRCIASGRAR